MSLAQEVGGLTLKSKSDSQLVENQFTNDYQVKEPYPVKYLKKVRDF